jgi:NDP-sugar pyrophosphorylase family protein
VNKGFKHITMAVNHRANLTKAFWGDGGQWGAQIDYPLEATSRGTIAPLTLIRHLPGHFLLMNGDVLTDLDFGMFWDRHVSAGSAFTIAAAFREEQTEYGVVHVGGRLKLIGFEEKPRTNYSASVGV